MCSGFDDSSGWAFFDLTSVYDDYCEESITIVEAEFVCSCHLYQFENIQHFHQDVLTLSTYFSV